MKEEAGEVKKNWEGIFVSPRCIYSFCIFDGHCDTSSLERDCEILGVLEPGARLKLFA